MALSITTWHPEDEQIPGEEHSPVGKVGPIVNHENLALLSLHYTLIREFLYLDKHLILVELPPCPEPSDN